MWEELAKLLEAGFIREIKNPDWLANLMIVPKKDTLQKKYTYVMIRVCHSRSRFLSCTYIPDKFMTESR